MKLDRIRIENFRSFRDETIVFDNYTCLVGPNGCGKSTVLMALNVFFRNTGATVTNVTTLIKEDYHHCDTSQPIRITLTFKDLSNDAAEDFRLYYRQQKLTITAKAIWHEASQAAEVKQYGDRLVMKAFAPYFKAVEDRAKASELKDIYDALREAISDLPNATSGPTREAALREYEEAHPELCEIIESQNEFFGFTKGANLLNKYVQWVYIPAVKDASSEQEESNKTALGQLLQRSIRSQINFKDSIAELKHKLEKEYREILDDEKNSLDKISIAMERRLREWASPDAILKLGWHFDPNKSVSVQEPIARASIGEDRFIGEIARLGHGMQRSFLVALLHELALSGGQEGPTLILGFEEPELYQHPSQALHIASVLEDLADNTTTNSQVIISTHSPHFVSARGFENIRVVRKDRVDKCSQVASTTFDRYEKVIADAVNGKPDLPSVVMTSLEQIMQPSQRELYFTKFAVLVEGIEDVAFIATHLKLTQRWVEFRKCGCHFIVSIGKTNLSRPIVIARELCIPFFAVFDADGNDASNANGHKRDNDCLFKLLDFETSTSFPAEISWGDQFVCWPNCIFDSVKEEIGDNHWSDAATQAKLTNGYVSGVKQKNNMLIAAVLEELSKRGIHSQVLTKLCDRMLARASDSLKEAVSNAPTATMASSE